jgi:Methyltransferase domain
MTAFPLAGLEDVPGFLTAGAATLLDRLAQHQSAVGIQGDIVEIGVFYGRSALVLGAALEEGERLMAVDSFEIGADDVPGWSFPPSGRPEEALRREWRRRVGGPGSLQVLRTDSSALRPGDLPADSRIVHVDGGHGYGQVMHDAALAEAAIGPRGVVVFDDLLLPEWPDVTVAVIDHLRSRRPVLVPFLVAEHKGFCCRPAERERYIGWAREAVGAVYPPPRHLVATRGFCGEDVVVVSRLPAS